MSQWHNDGERNTMIVYRFERNGIGPYVSGRGTVMVLYRNDRQTRTSKKYRALLDERCRQIDTEKRIQNYSKAHQDKKYMYGCKSKEQLRMYFGGEFKSLFKEGFRIKRYRVPDDEIIDIELEVAFPVKYHKFQNMKRMRANVK